MKNLLLCLTAVFSLILPNTCSVNDNVEVERQTTDNELVVSINGVEKTFNSVTITEHDGDSNNNVSGILNIEASIDNLPDEVLKIDLFMDVTGADVVYKILYIKDSELYYLDYTSNVGNNDDNDLSLAFSGNVWSYNEGSQDKEIAYEFTNGSLSAGR